MKAFSNLFKRTGRSSKKIVLGVAMFLTLASASLVGVSTLNTGKVDAAAASACGSNSSNSIIRNGEPSRSAFISAVKSSSQLQAIYASSGLTSADYNRFISDAKPGLALDNNTIVVSGHVVATGAGSFGRLASCQGSNPVHRTVGGVTIYGNYNSKAFASGTHSLPVDVLFNAQGKIQFAVMTGACGNPTFQTPTTPPTCKELNAKNLGNNQYELTTSITNGTAGESVNKVVYTFSDGRTAITRTSASNGYQATVSISKNVTVTAHVYVNLPGGGTAISSNCPKTLTFTPPPAIYACTLLNLTVGAIDNKGNATYTLAAQASATNATVKSYTFTFGDNTANKVVATTAKSTSLTHVYAPGSYSAKVLVTFVTNTGATVTAGNSGKCVQPVVVKPLTTSLTCVSLTPNKGEVDATTGNTAYTFTAKATATNATITSYVFTFGDNTPAQTVTTNATTADSASHTYVASANAYTASVTVNATDVNGKHLSDTGPTCQTPVSVPKPSTPGVTITKHVDNVKDEQVAVGQVFTYELVVTNTGNVNLVNAVVTDTPPAGVTLLTADKGTISNNTWTYTIPNLAVGASASFNLTAKVPAQVDGSLVNTACVNAVEVNPGQPNQTDACDTATVHVPPVVPKNPNITITKTVDGQKSKQVAVGQNFVYQLIVKNTGEKDLVNAVVTDAAPAGVTLLSADLGSVTSGTSWTYTIPNLAVGASITVNITAKVATYVPGSLVNTACVNAVEVNPEQPTQPDTCDTATVTVTPPVTTPTPPTTLVNTGAGSVIGLFGLSALIGTIAHRLFLSRRLSRES